MKYNIPNYMLLELESLKNKLSDISKLIKKKHTNIGNFYFFI